MGWGVKAVSVSITFLSAIVWTWVGGDFKIYQEVTKIKSGQCSFFICLKSIFKSLCSWELVLKRDKRFCLQTRLTPRSRVHMIKNEQSKTKPAVLFLISSIHYINVRKNVLFNGIYMKKKKKTVSVTNLSCIFCTDCSHPVTPQRRDTSVFHPLPGEKRQITGGRVGKPRPHRHRHSSDDPPRPLAGMWAFCPRRRHASVRFILQ